MAALERLTVSEMEDCDMELLASCTCLTQLTLEKLIEVSNLGAEGSFLFLLYN